MFWTWRKYLSLTLSFSVLAMGAVLYSQKIQEKTSKVKSADRYWAETGLNAESLESLLSPASCASSERYFLACVNSISSVASRYNLTLDLAGKLVSHQSQKSVATSEKAQLELWQKHYQSAPVQVASIDFISVWNELAESYIPADQMAMAIGNGLNGFMSVLRDPHTYLMPVSQFKEVVSKAEARSANLGLYLGVRNQQFVLRKVVGESPAAQAGLKKGDILLEVNGQKTAGLLQARVSELLKGEIGDVLKLKIQRDGKTQRIQLTRREMKTSVVSIQIIDGAKPVAIVGLNKFAKKSCEHVKSAIEVVNKSPAQGLLLDLRDNPGGYMEEAACIVSLFVGPDKKIMEVRYLDSEKPSEVYYGGEDQIYSKPLAVLVNSTSASASEIVAGALRDLKRAVVVGERTFGKGSFQEGELWEKNKSIALFETKGFYYLPSGVSPQIVGVKPDVEVEFDSIRSQREQELYMFPLKAPGRNLDQKSRLAYEGCLQKNEATSSEDLQMTTAKQLLFCVPSVARAAL